MNWRSHAIGGAVAAKGVLVVAAQVPALHGHLPVGLLAEAPMIATASFAALWPDGDSPNTKFGHCLPGRRVYGRDGHAGRSFLGVTCWHRRRWHSVGALGIVGAVALLLALGSGVSWTIGLAVGVILGYGSHLLADIPYGKQMLCWPFSNRLVGWAEISRGIGAAALRAVRLG